MGYAPENTIPCPRLTAPTAGLAPWYRNLWALLFSAAFHAALLAWGYWVIERVQVKPPAAEIAAHLVLLDPGPPAVAAARRTPAAAARPVQAKPRAAPNTTLQNPPTPLPAKVLAAPADAPAFPTAAPPNQPAAPFGAETNGTQGSGAGESSASNLPRDAPAGEGAAVDSAASHRAVVSAVRDGIDAAKRYPRLARQAGFEGSTLLAFKLLSSGDVQDLRVVESSGHSILDEAALNAVTRAAPFSEAGSRIAGAFIELILPVVFQLN